MVPASRHFSRRIEVLGGVSSLSWFTPGDIALPGKVARKWFSELKR